MNTTDKIYNKLLKRIEKLVKHNHTTFSTELYDVGKHIFGNKFHGVYSSDKIPKLKNRQYCIVNLDASDESGSHWIALARNKDKTYFYDSFGRPNKIILPSLNKSGNGSVLNTEDDREQGFKESNCGQRCIAFLLFFDLYGAEKALEI